MCGNAGVSGTRQYMWIGGFPLWRAGKVWLWLNGRESFCGDSPEFDPVLSVSVIFWRFGGVADTQRQKKKIGISEWGRSFWSRLSFFFSRANLNLPCVRTQCETRGAERGQIMMSVKGVKNAVLWDFFWIYLHNLLSKIHMIMIEGWMGRFFTGKGGTSRRLTWAPSGCKRKESAIRGPIWGYPRHGF